MPDVVWSLVAQINDIQIQWNGQTTEKQAQSLSQCSQPMTIIINHLIRLTSSHVQMGIFEFVQQVVHYAKQVNHQVYHGAHHG